LKSGGNHTGHRILRIVAQKRVLVVEDDPEIVELLELHLKDLGLEVDAASTGPGALSRTKETEYALVLLDLMLPEMDGLEVCRQIRREDSSIPILILTAKSEELDKVLGLELGADDYVTKPFSIRELMARVRALLRRRDQDASGTGTTDGRTDAEPERVIDFGDLVIDSGKRRVRIDDRLVDLTAKEYELLLLLCRHPGQAFSRKQLLELVWGYHYEGYSHTVNSHINRLRSKIEADSSNPRYIQTVWGFG
jgi:two-component system, OmpR family, alkaline phosphatase synthesis response regulator PhoP